MSKDYYWGWLYEEDKEPRLFLGDPDRYDFEKHEKITDSSTISAGILLVYLQREAECANRHHMFDGYQRLFDILKSTFPEETVRTVLRKIIEAGGIHDE